MHRGRMLCAAVLLAVLCLPAVADLQNVEVGGEVHVRGNYWTSPASPNSFSSRNPLFQWPWTDDFRGVAGGNPFAGLRWQPQPGRLAVFSPVDWSDRGPNLSFVEQQTRLNALADFTDEVSAFIELESYDVWGTDFRSDYVTGADRAGDTRDDVEIYQAYIEANQMWDMPLRLRVGRQEITLGSGWLIGNNEAGSYFTGLSFDAIRLTYATEMFSVDAIAAKLNEVGALEEDGDTDLYVLYASYLGLPEITIDGYWMMVRDAGAISDTNGTWAPELVEDVLGVDNYDPTYLHTVGLRGAGKVGGFDFESEIAYQFGNADSANRLFAGSGLQSPYGPDGEEFDAWAANLQVGYLMDVAWSPRPFVGGAYFGGEDERDLGFGEWLGAVYCPFYQGDSSLSFNRLFSNWQYSNYPDAPFQDISNLWLAYVGVVFTPVESFTGIVSAAYVGSLESYDAPWPTFRFLGRRFAPLSFFSFLDKENDDSLAWDFSVKGIYRYSEDLSVEAGWSHLFVEDGLSQGSFNIGNGLAFEGGIEQDDADYFYVDTKLKF